jgi:hypothetical protein
MLQVRGSMSSPPISSLVLSKCNREATIRNLPAADLKLSALAAYENIVFKPVKIVVKEEIAPTVMLNVGFAAMLMMGEALKKLPNEATVPRT